MTETTKGIPICMARRPDGYNGHTIDVKLQLMDSHIIAVLEWGGSYNTGLPPCIDKAEALWIIEHHPSSIYTVIEEEK